jgi:glycosyltransferase involved in cell wall biosynthesis
VARVLLIHQPVAGGVGRHVSDLARGLHTAGHEVVLCGPGRPATGPDDCRHVALTLERAVAPRADARALRDLDRIVRRLAPDLVHAHSSKAGAIARLVRAVHPRLPLVYSPHGYAFAGHFDREVERTAYRVIEAGLAPLASRVICVCDAEARLARRIGPAPRIRVVHNGVAAADDPVMPDPRMTELARAGPVICTLTQLRPGKGLETLLDAMPAILGAHPGAQLAIWGDGPDQPQLAARARTLSIGDSVHFLGATRSPLSVMAASDVFTLPSLAEAFPYVILEAMSVACPVVSSDVGGIAEALVEGTGVLVNPADPVALATAIATLLDRPDMARRLGTAARRRVQQMFSVERMLSQTAQVYDALVPGFLGDAQGGHRACRV